MKSRKSANISDGGGLSGPGQAFGSALEGWIRALVAETVEKRLAEAGRSEPAAGPLQRRTPVQGSSEAVYNCLSPLPDILLPIRPRGGAPRRESVIGRTGLNPATIYRLIRTGDFPRPVKFGRSSLWPESEIDAWVEAMKARRR